MPVQKKSGNLLNSPRMSSRKICPEQMQESIEEFLLCNRPYFFSITPRLFRLTWLVCEIGWRWLYSCYFVVLLPGFIQDGTSHSCVIPANNFFFVHFVSVFVVHLYSSTDMNLVYFIRDIRFPYDR